MRGTGFRNVVNQEGKILFDENAYKYVTVDNDRKLIWGRKDSLSSDEVENKNHIVDFSGNVIYSDFIKVDEVSGEEITVEKYEGDRLIKIIIDCTGKELRRIE